MCVCTYVRFKALCISSQLYGVHMCMHVLFTCIYIYIYIYIYMDSMHKYPYIHTHVYTHITHMYIQINSCVVCTNTHTCMRAHTRMYIHTYTFLLCSIHKNPHIHTYIYKHTKKTYAHVRGLMGFLRSVSFESSEQQSKPSQQNNTHDEEKVLHEKSHTHRYAYWDVCM
jgi:hypothetical protein